jgi:hypothetical protein
MPGDDSPGKWLLREEELIIRTSIQTCFLNRGLLSHSTEEKHCHSDGNNEYNYA